MDIVNILEHTIVIDQISHWRREKRWHDPREQDSREVVFVYLKSGVTIEIECNSAKEVSDFLIEAFEIRAASRRIR